MRDQSDNLFLKILLVICVIAACVGVVWGVKKVNSSSHMLEASRIYKVTHYSGGVKLGTYVGHVESCGDGCISVRPDGNEFMRYFWGDFVVEEWQ